MAISNVDQKSKLNLRCYKHFKNVFEFEKIFVFFCLTIVCPTVEDGPKLKLAFWYPVSQLSSDCHEILQPLLSRL